MCSITKKNNSTGRMISSVEMSDAENCENDKRKDKNRRKDRSRKGGMNKQRNTKSEGRK